MREGRGTVNSKSKSSINLQLDSSGWAFQEPESFAFPSFPKGVTLSSELVSKKEVEKLIVMLFPAYSKGENSQE
jgi:hypothetical protein